MNPRGTAKAIEHLAARSHLPASVVSRLLKAGWSYTESIQGTARWDSPARLLTKTAAGHGERAFGVVYRPAAPRKRHRCMPPVNGTGLNAADPLEPIGTIWRCPEKGCGRYYRASTFSPLLPGWTRIPARLARKLRG